MHQVIEASADFVAKAPKIWVGSEAENALGLVSEFMAATIAALNTLSSHTHPSVGTITQGSSVSGQASAIGAVKVRLDGVKM